MKAKFVAKKSYRCLLAALAVALVFVLAGCGGNKAAGTSDGFDSDKIVEAGPGDINVNADADDSGAGDSGKSGGDDAEVEDKEADEPRVTDVSQSDAEVHVVLRELDFGEGIEAENRYYRTVTDESGLACYEIQPADSDEPVFVPMASTVIYMTEQDASDVDAYYEQITLTYLLDGESVQSTQYQIFVPNPIASNVMESSAD